MQLADIIAHIWRFCLMLRDLPFLFQEPSHVQHSFLNADNRHKAGKTSLTSTTSSISTPISTNHTWNCPKPNSDLTPVLCSTCNTPENRTQWCGGFDIYTDYEIHVPNTGVTRKFTLVLTNTEYCGDGYVVPRTLINGSYPGPLLEGDWGDWFEITVINELTNCNGTAIHWHGIRQWNTVWEDGVGGVTQCPIPPQIPVGYQVPTPPPPGYTNRFTYRWRATQYGASWYHSHFSLQYANGAVGPLLIHGPTSENYDVDKGPLLITDWFHHDAFSIYWIEIFKTPNTLIFNPPAKLINGRGKFLVVNSCHDGTEPGCDPETCNRCVPDEGGYYKTGVEHGKVYRFRIINTSITTHYRFWIDWHEMTVIGTDFVPIHKYTTKVLNIAIGQRYDVLVHANANIEKSPNFWIRMRNCQNIPLNEKCPFSNDTLCTWEESRQGILSYDLNSNKSPDLNLEPDSGDLKCEDADPSLLKPVVPRTVPQPNDSPYFRDAFPVSLNTYTESGNEVRHWSLMQSGQTFIIDWRQPALLLIQSGILAPDEWNSSYVPIMVNSTGPNQWTTFIIESNWTKTVLDMNPGLRLPDLDVQIDLHAVPAAHPMHLHGHDFVILYQGKEGELYDPKHPPKLQLENPPRRDVVMLPKNGYVILAFRIDNPGSWLMHCHIAWHASNGLALQFVEDQRKILPLMVNNPDYPHVVQQLRQQCNNWQWWYSTECKYMGEVARQDDSGI